MAQETFQKPLALILAGYDKPDRKTMIRRKKQIIEAYDGDEIFIGKNKFLQDLAGKPVIQYILDAVHGARRNGQPLYEKIYVYNDVQNFTDVIDTRKYDNLVVKQMTKSVGGHWRDFYFNHAEYGRRVDLFFGDTPRVTSADVEWIHGEYDRILGKEKDLRGVTSHVAFSIVEYEDMKDDNWLPHRIRFIKHGQNRGKLKAFVGFENFQARVGNSTAIIKHRSMDQVIDREVVNFFYNLRKALTPNTFSKILYYLWKAGRMDVIGQVKRKCLGEEHFYTSFLAVAEKVYKIDLSGFGGYIYHIKKNAAHWENDIDGPKDLAAFRERMHAGNASRPGFKK
ncbi:MAG: hypothetical protein KBA61_04520 [Spirochaetes bacterium]|nr:hypothetical protein [Spirochaetota bacterium]